jgi:hypothetical protein
MHTAGFDCVVPAFGRQRRITDLPIISMTLITIAADRNTANKNVKRP